MNQLLIEDIRADFEMSSCSKCPFGARDECQHYYGNGCVYDENGEFKGV